MDYKYLNLTLNDSKEKNKRHREQRSSQKIRSVSRQHTTKKKEKKATKQRQRKKKPVLDKPEMTENTKRVLMSIENIRLNLDIATGTLDGIELGKHVNSTQKGFSSSKKQKQKKSKPKKIEISEEFSQTQVEPPKTNPNPG